MSKKKKVEDKGFENRFANIPVFLYKKGDRINAGFLGSGEVIEDMEIPVNLEYLLQLRVRIKPFHSAVSHYDVLYTSLNLEKQEENG